MRIARHTALAGALLLSTIPAGAQSDDDGGRIQRFLQDKLSAAGREVRISGFEGLLTGAARLSELTIADDKGVWLTLRDAELNWSRAALLRGNLAVETLAAGEIVLDRLPEPAPKDSTLPEPPNAEASGFSLPELPVSIRIDRLAIDRAELGEAVLGQAATLGLEGAVQLADGEGKVELDTRRLDRPGDHISLHGAFTNESRALSLDLEVQEEAGGLITTLMKLPGAPSLDLSVKGDGPLSDFTADIGLRTDGQDRIAGQVTLKGTGDGGTGFSADIGGDITPLLPPEFHEFFGTDIRLLADGTRASDGALDMPGFSLAARSFDLEGSLSLAPGNIPSAFDLTGQMASATGGPLRLPVSGPGTFVDRVTLGAHFDAAESDRWTLNAEATGIETDAADIGRVSIEGFGKITADQGASVTADLLFDVGGLEMADDTLATATGPTLEGGVELDWTSGGALNITRLYAVGADYGLDVLGNARIAGRSLQLSGEGRLNAEDIARFSDLAGRPLTGAVRADVSGQADVLGGQFAASASVAGDGLSIGQETVDRLLEGPVSIDATARRDTGGTTLDDFALRSRAVIANASGKVGGGASDLGFEALLNDVGLVLPGHEGDLALSGTARETDAGDWQVALDMAGPYALAGNLAGRVHPGESVLTLDVGLPDIAPLVPGHEGPAHVSGRAAEAGKGKWNVDLDANGPYELTAAIEGLVAPGETEVSLDVTLPDIAPLVPGHSGAVALSGNAAQTSDTGWKFRFGGTGPYASTIDLDGTMGDGPGKVTLSAALPDVSPLLPGVSGPLRADGTATDAGDGLWQVDFNASGPIDGTAKVEGVAGGGQSDLALEIAMPDLSPLVPQLRGPLNASGRAAETGDGRWSVDFDADAPHGAKASFQGAVGGSNTDLRVNLDVPDLSPIAPGITGGVKAEAAAAQGEGGAWKLAIDATGPYRSTVSAGGTYLPGESQFDFSADLPDVGALAPAYSGPISLKGTAGVTAANAWDVALDALLPYNGTASISGAVASGETAMDLQVDLPTVAPFAPGLSGGFTARGNVAQSAEGYAVDLATQGPQGVSSAVTGTVAEDFSTLALGARGTAPLGLVNGVLSPNAVNGTARFDLTVNGPPSIEAITGTVSVKGADATMPTLRQSLRGIDVDLDLDRSSLRVDASADSPAGGSVAAQGSLGLTGGLNADLEARLRGFVLTDPTLFETVLDGRVSFTGPVTGGASIAGRINVGRTEFRVPDGGLGFGGAIPDLQHVKEPEAVFLTRQRAGLVREEKDETAASGSAPVYGLDVTVNAPDEIFIRGRGLDTELGGALVVGGTTANPKPVGEIKVIRGRLDILGQRLDMTDGTVSLVGGLIPYLDLIASSKRSDFEFLAEIYGPVNDPEIELTSVPDLPDDEVLAYFLFGQSVTDLSPLQAAQLANALATLSGRGGVGILGNLRQGLGLDDLNLSTTDGGGTQVSVGKYLSDNVYTEFLADDEGGTEIDINIDVSPTFTVKGTADSKGDSSIGIYFERDY